MAGSTREVFAISLTREEGRYAIEYAKRLGIQKTVFLQEMVSDMIKELQKRPLPEPVPEPPEVVVVPKSPPPESMTFWKRYKDEIGESNAKA